jgi:acetyltransferase-like isoleucine patch superfamily enzyme
MFNKIRTIWYILKYQYILKKATFGSNTLIKCKLEIKGSGKVTIGSGCSFEPDLWGDDHVTLYTHRPKARIVIGNNVTLRATRFGCHLSILIENNAILEYSSIFDTDYHNLDATKRDEIKEGGFNEGDRPVVIGEGSYVGCESLCSKGTCLGKNVILLPGTVIGTKRIADNSVISGNPGRIIKK